jgi:hypothetical protein
MNVRYNNDPTIVFYSKTVVEEGILPHRIVVRKDGDTCITCYENLVVSIALDERDHSTLTFDHGEFYSSRHFPTLEAAKANFSVRVKYL